MIRDSHLNLKKQFVNAAGAGAIALGSAVLVVGWTADSLVLKSVIPGLPTMKPNTAIAIALLGLSLTTVRMKRPPGRLFQFVGRLCAAIVAVVALLTLVQYAFSLDFGIDELFFRDTPGSVGVSAPGRMSSATALTLLLLGVPLLLLHADRAPVLTQALAGLALSISSLSCLSYLYGSDTLHHASLYSSMAIHTALTIFILSLGVLAASPDVGVVGLLTSEGSGSKLVRRLLPAAVLVPVTLGWLRLAGQRAGFYGLEFGLGMMVFANVVFFTGLLCWTALQIQRYDAKNKEAGESLRNSERRYRALVETTPQVVWTVPGDRNEPNEWWLKMTGQTAEETSGWGWLDAVHPDDRPRIRALWADACETQTLYQTEYRLRNRQGEYRHFAVRGIPLPDSRGIATQWFGTLTDIDDRKRAEEALRRSEQRFRVVVEASPSGLILVGHDGRIVLANEPLKRMFGYAEDELLGETVERLIPERHRDRHPAHRSSFFAKPEARMMGSGRDLWGLHKNGREFPVEVGLTPVEMEDGPFVLASVIDISARKKAEEQMRELNATLERRVEERTKALHAQEQRFRAIFHSQFQFIGLLSPDGVLLEANRKSLASSGASEASVLGKQFWETPWWTHDSVQQERLRAAIRLAAGGRQDRFEASHPTKEGALVWVDFSLTPFFDEFGQVIFLILEGRDITERKQMEEALREKSQVLGTILDSIGDAVMVANSDGTMLLRNRAFHQLHEKPENPGPPSEWPRVHGVHVPGGKELCPAEQLPIVRAMRGEPTDDIELEIVNERYPGGLPISVTGRPLSGPKGTAGGVIVIRDLAARRRSEAALRESEERFRSAFDHAPIGFALVSPVGRFLRVNRSLCEIVGYAEPELLAIDFQTITHPDDLESDLAYVRDMLEGNIRTYQMEKRYFHKKGHVVQILLSISMVRDGNGAPLYFIAQIKDVTQRREAERRTEASLREKEVLLKEIHHRVKNNLQIVSTLLDLQSDHTRDPEALEMFKESRRRVKSMALIHERLYRSQDLARVNFDQYIRQLADDLYQTYKLSSDEIKMDVDVNVAPLPIDIAIPCGLLLNELMSNCLKHAFKDVSQGAIRVSLRGADGTTILSVADNGVGFPHDLDFRNTTSFGMQLVQTLVEQLHGDVAMTNKRGTEFTVTFPHNR